MRFLFAVTLLLVCLSAVAGTPLPDAPHIVVSGEAKVSVKPDSARVRFAFEQRDAHALHAKQGVDTAVNRLLASLDTYAVADEDITASSLNASEDVDYTEDGKRVSNGFVAERNVTVVLKNINRLNDFLDNGLASGVHEIMGVEFESSRAESLRAEAKRKAVEDARKKAGGMAAAFGASLGSVYSIDSINSRHAGLYSATTLDRIQVTGSRMSPGRYIQPTVEYAESVSAVFELKR